MGESVRIGRIFGIHVYLHPTFFILFLFQGIQSVYRGDPIQRTLISLALLLCTVVVIVLHECGHALMARRFGIKTQRITLWPLGGFASLERIPHRPKQEFLIAIAGPLVNVVIALILFLILLPAALKFAFLNFIDSLWVSNRFLFEFMVINIGLAIFNLLPAFPLDGGRIFRSLLSLRLHRLRATQIAAVVGQGMAILFALVGIFYLKSPTMVLIALFVWFGAQREVNAT